jgi:flagellar biosynthesis repressor protein FlbT
MLIHLKRNERLFVNGAVLRLDRRGTIELLNDAQFLLENHVMQPDDATTPMRQLYFVVQTMILDLQNAPLTMVLFQTQVSQIERHSTSQVYLDVVQRVRGLVEQQDFFEGLKLLRRSFGLEEGLLTAPTLAKNNEVKAA